MAFLLAVFVTGVAEARKGKKGADPEEAWNPLLGIEYSHWLVGPIYHLATDDEVERYLRLTSDEEAARFIEDFWARRNEGTDFFAKTPEQIFEHRADEADGRYREGMVPGRRTDRGTIYILYGAPEETDYQISEKRDGPPVELWKYPKDAEPGLDGEKPKRVYRFVEVDGRTVFFTQASVTRATRERQRERARRPDF